MKMRLFGTVFLFLFVSAAAQGNRPIAPCLPTSYNATGQGCYCLPKGDGIQVTSPVAFDSQHHRTFFSSLNNSLFAVDTTTGAKLWTFTVKGSLSSDDVMDDPPTLSPDGAQVYVTSGDNHLYALNASNGHLNWAYNVTGENGYFFEPAVVTSDGSTVIVQKDGVVHALHSATGGTLWTTKAGTDLGMSITLNRAEDTLYMAKGGDALLFAIDVTTGGIRWRTELGVDAGSSVVEGDGVLFIQQGQNTNGPLQGTGAYNASTGTKMWVAPHRLIRLNIEAPVLALGNSIVISGSDDGNTRAFCAQTGKVVWIFPRGGNVPVLGRGKHGDIGYIQGRLDNNLYAVNMKSGVLAWQFPSFGRFLGLAVSGDGETIVATYSGIPPPGPTAWSMLVGIDATDHTQLWVSNMMWSPGTIQFPPANVHGDLSSTRAVVTIFKSTVVEIDAQTGQEGWEGPKAHCYDSGQ